MLMKVLQKVNVKLKFLYRQNKYLTQRSGKLLCNTLIHSTLITDTHHGFPFSIKILNTNFGRHKTNTLFRFTPSLIQM